MKFNLLTNEEAFDLTNSVVDQILNVNAEKMVKAFYYWQGIITALAMIISEYKAIELIEKEKMNIVPRIDDYLITHFDKVINEHRAVIVESEFNFNQYKELLFELGVKID